MTSDPTGEGLARALVESGRRERPSAASRERARRAALTAMASATAASLGAASGGTAAAAAGASAAGAAGFAGTAVAKWAMIVVATASVGGGAWMLRSTPPPAVEPGAAPPAPAPPTITALPVPESAPADEPTLVVPEPKVAPPPRREPAAPGLKHEVSALDEVRTALEQKRFAAAKTGLRRYQQRFPAGALRVEAERLQIELLVGRGEFRAARAAARRFEVRHPGSPHLQRIRSLTSVR